MMTNFSFDLLCLDFRSEHWTSTQGASWELTYTYITHSFILEIALQEKSVETDPVIIKDISVLIFQFLWICLNSTDNVLAENYQYLFC